MKNIRDLFIGAILILILNSLSLLPTYAQWQTISAGTYNGLWFTDANTGYAVGNDGVIRKTADGGTTWTILKSGTTRTLYAVTFTSSTTGYVTGISGTILKTTDAGVTWAALTSGIITDIRAISFADGNIGIAAGLGGKIIRTTDAGATWGAVTSGVTSSVTLRGARFHSSTNGFVVGTSGNVLKTTDAGATWTVLGVGVSSAQLNNVWFLNDNTGYAISQGGIMYKTTDGGTNWATINSTSTPKSGTTNALTAIWFTSSTNGFISANSGTIIKTADNGVSDWTAQTISGVTVSLNAIHFPDVNTGYAVGNNGTIVKTTDGGGTWNAISPSVYNTNALNGIYFPNTTAGFAVGASGGILKSSNAGESWELQTSGTSNTLNGVYFTAASTGYTAGNSGTILKTTDGGTNWTSLTSGSSYNLRSIYFTDANTGYAAGEYGTVLKTTNAGTNWASVAYSSEDPTLNGIHFISSTIGIAVGDYGLIYKTTDAGSNFSWKTSGTSNNLNDVYFTAGSTTGYAVGASGTILKTINSGDTWTTLTSGTSNALYSVHFLTDNVGYVTGASGTVRKTIDGGANWTAENVMSTAQGNSIYFPDNNTGYISASSGYILKTFLITAAAPTVSTDVPSSITSNSAIMGGNVTSGGSASVTDRGVVYATTTSPTTANTKVQIGTGTGTFSQTATGFSPSTTYYVRAYAINTEGTSYGNQQSFTTSAAGASVSSVNRKTPAGTITNASSVDFEITLGASITGLSTSNLALTTSGISGASITNVAGSGTTWTVSVNTGAGDGTLRLDVNNTSGTTPALTNVPFTSGEAYTIDKTPPVPTISSVKTSPTNSNPIPVKVDFTENVTGFDISDITVSGGTKSNFAGSNKNYTFDLTPSGDGTITVDIAAGIAQDVATNNNIVATQYSIIYDNTKPTVIISSIKSSPTNSNPIPVKVDFSEDVTGVDLADMVVSGGTKSNFAGSGKNYTFDITPSAPGTITVDVAASVAQDAALNNNTVANQFSIVYFSCSATEIGTQPAIQNICIGANAAFSVTAAGSGLTYKWQVNEGDGFSNITDNALYHGSSTSSLSITNAPTSINSHQYKVIITNGCNQDVSSSIAQLNIIQVNAPQVTSVSRVGQGTVTLTATGGTDGNYRWYTSFIGEAIEGQVNGNYITPALTANATFYVAISNGTCESTRIPVAVEIKSPSAPIPPVITPGQIFLIEENSKKGSLVGTVAATDGDGNTFINWTILSGNTGNTFILDPTTGSISVNDPSQLDFEAIQSFTLTLTVSDGENTSIQETVTINLKDIDENEPEIFIPSAFSPNGDNVNDTWELKGLGFYSKSEVKIFNTDGHELFSNIGYSLQWDGRYKGKEMSLGTYYYIIKLNDASEKIYKGNLMIIN